MKKILNTILAVACFAGIVLAGCENMDGSCDIVWTLGWMTEATITGLIYGHINRKECAR